MRYLGGKFRNSDWVQSFFPDHFLYVEAFAGAASVLMTKKPSQREIYNDLDSEICNVFRVLRDKPQQLINAIELTPYSRSEWELSYKPSEDPVEQARRTIFRSFSSFGSAGATKGKSGFRVSCGFKSSYPVKKWNEYPCYIEDFKNRLKNVLIENRPALDLIKEHDSETTLFYLDPPYVLDTRVMGSGSKYYQFEMTNQQHKDLITVIKNLQGFVVLSGYDHEIYKPLTDAGWQKHSTRSRAAGFRGTVSRIETVWVNPKVIENKKQQELFL